jgi:hypothetical protein
VPGDRVDGFADAKVAHLTGLVSDQPIFHDDPIIYTIIAPIIKDLAMARADAMANL